MAQAVIISGRVMRVRARRGGGWRVRLTDTGGRLAAAEIRSTHPLFPPPVGTRIVIRGCIRFDEAHNWYTIDPVEEWRQEHPR
jgi:hypothetical protein